MRRADVNADTARRDSALVLSFHDFSCQIFVELTDVGGLLERAVDYVDFLLVRDGLLCFNDTDLVKVARAVWLLQNRSRFDILSNLIICLLATCTILRWQLFYHNLLRNLGRHFVEALVLEVGDRLLAFSKRIVLHYILRFRLRGRLFFNAVEDV